MKLVLASTSPRRSEILSSLGLDFTVIRPEADENSGIEDPGALTEELSRRKAQDALRILGSTVDEETLVLACDTVVYCDGEVLGKPRDLNDARRMLRMLSGKTHSVVSGICLANKEKTVTAHEVTYVSFLPLTDEDIDFCVRHGGVLDKAGAYAVQGLMSLWVAGLEGDYFNVVGLPVCLLNRTLLGEFDVDLKNSITQDF